MAEIHADWWRNGVIIIKFIPAPFRIVTTTVSATLLSGLSEGCPIWSNSGVDIIRLSPIFTSPMGRSYQDIENDIDVDPLFGTLVDLECLIDKAHLAEGLKVVLHFVPKSSAPLYPWFIQSRSSRNHPNAHLVHLAGSLRLTVLLRTTGSSLVVAPGSMTHRHSNTFITHSSPQPDLNWRNAEVRHAMHEAHVLSAQQGAWMG